MGQGASVCVINKKSRSGERVVNWLRILHTWGIATEHDHPVTFHLVTIIILVNRLHKFESLPVTVAKRIIRTQSQN